jgi:hypothetical protein
MNEQISTNTSGSGALALLLVIGLGCRCWLSWGPRFLRWPLLALLVRMTTGHWMGSIEAADMDALAEPVLTLMIVVAGLLIMLRGVGCRPRRNYYRDRWRRYERW